MKISLVVLPVFFVSMTFAQNVVKTNSGLRSTIDGVSIELQFFTPQIVRIVKWPEGVDFKKESLSVIQTPENIPLTYDQAVDAAIIKSDSLLVELNTKTGKISFRTPDRNLLLSEKDFGIQFTAIRDVNKNTFAVRQAFRLDKEEPIYGLGQQQNGKLNQRNQKVYLRQDNMKVSIPFFQSLKGYGVFWDNYSPTTFTDNPQETSFDSEVGDCADYYFVWGGNADGVIVKLRQLTGQVPLFPLWVYGFNQSRERYKTQWELVEVLKKYRELKVPIDGIIQDWQYWGKDSNWNAMSFDPHTFPDPKGMIDSVHKLNAHIFVVAWPGFGPQTKLYSEFRKKDMLLHFQTWPPKDGVTPYDPYNPAARNLYWQELNKGVFSLDVDAWWLDSSEPDHMNIKDRDFDLPTYLGTFRSVRNAYPIQHVGGVSIHQRATTSAKRVTILTRSAFLGQQRFGANTWSGDVQSNWQTFRRQIPAGLNFSLTGLPYWNTDIGGFFAGHFRSGGGNKNPEFQQLYTRWMQFATFTPMMRSHGTDFPREIYQWGQRGEWPFDVQEKFINLRYRLLPYQYATAWQVTKNSGSIFRALISDFASDTQVHNLDNEYLFGSSFLVSPVTEKDSRSQHVYLPAGAAWYDFWTGEKTEGGSSVNKETPIDIIPLYVKAGSIIPWGPIVQFSGEKKWQDLEVRIYPGEDANFVLYEDENDNYNYEKGLFSEIRFNWSDKTRTLTINERQGSFPGMLKTRTFNIVLADQTKIRGVTDIEEFDKKIKYSGKTVKVKF